MDISRCWNANMQLLIPTPTKLHISKTAAQNGQQPEIAMPSIFISNVMPRMPQLFGAVRIGPTRASENPGKAGIAGPEMQSSKFQIIQASPDGS